MVTIEELKAQIRAMGIEKDDTVLKIYSRAEEDLCIRIMDLDPNLWR